MTGSYFGHAVVGIVRQKDRILIAEMVRVQYFSTVIFIWKLTSFRIFIAVRWKNLAKYEGEKVS